ncbi:MAG TPA: M35 family metallo-endopeptidase [Gemmatimonadaceae bacterium]|jgi:hypothetical protein
MWDSKQLLLITERIQKANSHFERFKKSSIHDLVALVTTKPAPPPTKVSKALADLKANPEKFAKYREVHDYIAQNYPGLIDTTWGNVPLFHGGTPEVGSAGDREGRVTHQTHNVKLVDFTLGAFGDDPGEFALSVAATFACMTALKLTIRACRDAMVRVQQAMPGIRPAKRGMFSSRPAPTVTPDGAGFYADPDVRNYQTYLDLSLDPVGVDKVKLIFDNMVNLTWTRDIEVYYVPTHPQIPFEYFAFVDQSERPPAKVSLGTLFFLSPHGLMHRPVVPPGAHNPGGAAIADAKLGSALNATVVTIIHEFTHLPWIGNLLDVQPNPYDEAVCIANAKNHTDRALTNAENYCLFAKKYVMASYGL